MATETLKTLREEQETALAEARTALDEIETADESRSKELEEQHDRAMARYDELEVKAEREEKHAERQRKLAERQDELNQIDKDKRPGGGERTAKGAGETEDTPEAREKKKAEAFGAFLRHGFGGCTDEQREIIRAQSREVRQIVGENEARAQGVSTSAAGGALVPEDFMAELVKSLKAFGPMNDAEIVNRIETATGADLPWPTVDDTSNEGALLAENTQVGEQDVTFSSKTLEAYKYTTKLIRVSNELLQDSVFNVEEWLRMLMAERVGRILNRHFTTGTGSSQPNGIATASTLGVTAASSTTLTADELIDLEHSVDPAYRSDPSCRFMFNDDTFKIIRKLKDGQSNYLWQPADLRVGAPASFLGYPYSVNQAMNSFEGISPDGDNRPVIFGAMNRYAVRMVRALAVRRLTERYADYDQVGFVGFMRADGELMDTAAVKHLKSAAV